MRSVLAAIRATAATLPGRIAISDPLGTLSYGALADAIARHAATLAPTPQVVGLLMPRDRSHIVADLALASLGRTVVPLPDFFSLEQWRHMAADAGIGAIVTTAGWQDRVAGLGIPVVIAADAKGRLLTAESSRRIIYTSGTTGRPKGVVLTETAMDASLDGLERASGATAADIHLSLLPFSLLLEQLAGILLPLKVGARIHIAASPLEAGAVGATTSVVVPNLLAGWVGALRATATRAPSCLRYVAVGGAPVGEALAESAWALGLPVHEGYGLSECCSVVAVNRPGQRRAGTVGHPLDGIGVTIEDGEIVVRGATVMSGYLGGAEAGGVWRTGDLGRIEADGRVVVLGRKDDVVVTANGRNIHPEWIEPMLLADPAIRHCAVIAGESGLKAVVVPADPAAPHSAGHWLPRVQALAATAPGYAQPAEVAVLPAAFAQHHALFTLDGRPRRRRIAQILSEVPVSFFDTLLAETTAERTEFMSIPLIAEAVAGGVDRALYLSFLNSAYHHVRYTVPLLQTALAACGPDDTVMAEGLAEYVREEIGHDEWILDDIAALGGDAEASRHARPPLAVRVLVAHAFHLINEEGPYALLGMVHVLEGMSVALAVRAADAIRSALAVDGKTGGFSYLTSHGGLDIGHVDTFAKLLDAIDTPERRATVIAAARDFYTLYGNVFRALRPAAEQVTHAA
jgi:acyl-coenzyme A synthetase/AMP-(fatty) acid ligase/heme oxygenase